MDQVNMTSLKDMTSLNSMTPEEINNLKIKRWNEKQGNLKYIDCPICLNKGAVMVATYDERYDYYDSNLVECVCMTKRRKLERAEKSGLGDYLKKTFDDYQAPEEWQRIVKDKALKYLEENDKWFIFSGQSGCGKTLICSIIANQLFANHDVLYITWTDYIGRLKRDMMSDNAGAVTRYLDEIKNVEILYIDELLKTYTDADLKYIVEIINYRYAKKLKTIITTERTLAEILDIDEATFGRVYEMADGYCLSVPKDKRKNWRIKNAGKESL